MALRWPFMCKDTSNTAGTAAAYVLNDSVAVGYRNLTRAVTDGDLANGDEVVYVAWDSTVTGGPKLVEVGRGAWNNSTKNLGRTTIYQPGGTIVNWGAGVRDIWISNDPVLMLLLEGGTMTGVLKVLIAGSIISQAADTVAVFQRSASSNDAGISVVAHTAGIARLNLGDTAVEKQGGLTYNNSTDALALLTAGSARATISSAGVITDASAKIYIAFAGSAATKLPFYQGTAPVGWTRITGIEGRAARFSDAGGGSDSGTSGRQDIMSLTVSDVTFGTQSVQSGAGATVYNTVSNPHNHTLLIRYLDFLLASKD